MTLADAAWQAVRELFYALERCAPVVRNPVQHLHSFAQDAVLLSAMLFGANEAHSLNALYDRLGIQNPAKRRHIALDDAESRRLHRARCSRCPGYVASTRIAGP